MDGGTGHKGEAVEAAGISRQKGGERVTVATEGKRHLERLDKRLDALALLMSQADSQGHIAVKSSRVGEVPHVVDLGRSHHRPELVALQWATRTLNGRQVQAILREVGVVSRRRIEEKKEGVEEIGAAHIAVLIQRAWILDQRVKQATQHGQDLSFDKAEVSALRWAINALRHVRVQRALREGKCAAGRRPPTSG